MSEAAFISEEKKTSSHQIWKANFRLFRSLPLFLKFLPLSMVCIIASSAAPALFRWYSGQLSNHTHGFSLGNLWLITLGAVIFRILAWMAFEMSGMWASQRIHHQMISSLASVRTTYFDENPSGRLINRLVSDFDQVRSTAIIFVGDLLNALIEVAAIAIVASFAHWSAGFLIIPLVMGFFHIQKHRSAMLAHARTLSAVSTSHVLARQNDLIEGREIFLLYGKSSILLKRMRNSFHEYLQASSIAGYIEAWGSFWIRAAGETFSFVVLIFLAFALYRHSIDQTLAGVIISSLFGVTATIGWLDFATSLIARSLPHIERVFEITDLPDETSEERASGPARKMATIPSYPSPPNIELRSFTMSYRKDSPIILNQVSLCFPSGKRIALVGRTGSGKTSLIQALLRMVYVHEGDIVLVDPASGDESSIFNFEVREFRKRFGVIPQSPYLFAGTLRDNLDLTQTIAEEILLNALKTVGLEFSLDHHVIEGGQNFSQGERQLVCLARVIASNKDWIIMDEATSGLDPETDARITRLLQDELSRKTVITIAHRPETIQNYDIVVEFSHGKVVAITQN